MPLLAIMAASLAVVLPFSFWGNASGHDFEFHMNSWIDVLSQWKHGVAYPQWAWQAQWGYGEARFIFYPPASWTLGGLLGAILPWYLVPAAYIWIALTLSGCAMFWLAREWLEKRDAMFAAVLYAVNPYYLVVVYWRSAFAELLAGALLPLLLLYVLRLQRDQRRAALALALIVAAAWLTNIPAAVMLNYSLALLIVAAAWFHGSRRILAWGAFAVVLGAALAAFFLVPVAGEQKWTQIAQVLSPGVRPQDNFLFTLIADPDHNRFNLLVSLVAAAEMVLLAAAVLCSRRWRTRSPLLWKELAIWALAACLLMFSITSLAWVFLPKLRFVQLPWRWLLCLNVAFALLVTMAWRRLPLRLLVYAAMLAVVALVWTRVQPPWWDTKLDIAEMAENQRTWIGYEGTDEYVPVGADSYEVKHDAPLVKFSEADSGQIKIEKWDPETKILTAEVAQPDWLTLRLFNYPAWRVQVNGREAVAQSKELTGQMQIPVEAGENRVRVRFVRTWDRTLGGMISLAAVVFAFLFASSNRNRSTAQ